MPVLYALMQNSFRRLQSLFKKMLSSTPWLLFPFSGEKEIGKERVRYFVKLHILNLDCFSRSAEYILREAGWEEDECG